MDRPMITRRHIAARMREAHLRASLSRCTRRQVGAILIDPTTNIHRASGYNGNARGAVGHLCGGDSCDRDAVESGTRLEVGCNHAESNAIGNAARVGASVDGTWCIVTTSPCLMCARLLLHSGVSRVIIDDSSYGDGDGVSYLKKHGVPVTLLSEYGNE